MKHLISADQVTKELFEEIYSISQIVKGALKSGRKKFSVLRGKCIVNLFFEPSTRTRSSFEKAGKFLSADVINISTSASSVKKGESLIDTVKNLDMMHPDVIVLRHPCEGAPETVKNFINASIVNAGDGRNQHPTQALLDAVTLKERLGSLEGKRITIVGDITNSRVARSDSILFRKLGAEVFIYGPSTMIPRYPEALGVKVLSSFDELVEVSDVVILLRIQLERQNAKRTFPSVREYSELFGLNGKKLERLKLDTLILHPGPFNRGVELTNDVVNYKNSLIFNQVETGLAVRMAVLSILCGRKEKLLEEVQ
ncbi:aspartate carbamoyltransferase [Balnearium lithotrophicum]|uniref:Aspartate carbamoyltransferase n=1 Tax=Balnearium lithotrophicum TaxID=223788 RepID=A0A521DEG6_9BACT|nr:aspartate carbamoyltransferase catalytic subunit [Balnearium lithotrophicum]SMO70026.1 aspartate carbamoyltransferase [Balnearium lithotrophicum]